MHDLDYTGSRALAELLDELDREQITFAVARAGQHAREGLQRSGLLARIGADHRYASVDEAVRALGPPEPPPA
jgi:MFS superfamily sulfate permease-like transporter